MIYSKNLIEYAGAWWIELSSPPIIKTIKNVKGFKDRILIKTIEWKIENLIDCKNLTIKIYIKDNWIKTNEVNTKTVSWATWLSSEDNKSLVMNSLDHINSIDYLTEQLDQIYKRA